MDTKIERFNMIIIDTTSTTHKNRSTQTVRKNTEQMIDFYANKFIQRTVKNKVTELDLVTGFYIEPAMMAKTLCDKIPKLTKNKQKIFFAHLDKFLNGKKPTLINQCMTKLDDSLQNKPSKLLKKILKTPTDEQAEASRKCFTRVIDNVHERFNEVAAENGPALKRNLRKLRIVAKQNGLSLSTLLRK